MSEGGYKGKPTPPGHSAGAEGAPGDFVPPKGSIGDPMSGVRTQREQAAAQIARTLKVWRKVGGGEQEGKGGKAEQSGSEAGREQAPQIGAKLDALVLRSKDDKGGGGKSPSQTSFTPQEIAILQRMNGGQELLDYLDNDDPKKGKASAPDKKRSLVEEAKVAINEAKSAPPELLAVGREIARSGGKGTLVEIDVETPDSIIQIKGGDFSKEEKLGGKDLQQLNNTKIYNEQLRGIDPKTAKKLPPKKLVWQFTKGVNPKLVSWLEGKGVQVRKP